MGRTLNWLDALLATARQRFELHQYHETYRLLYRFVISTSFDGNIDEARDLFMQACVKLGRFKEARRAAGILLRSQPDNAQCHHLMGRAIESDPAIDAARALRCYRRAIKLDPRNVEYLCDAGQLAVSMGMEDAGFGWLRRALDLAPDSLNAIGMLVDSLSQCERYDEARELLAEARFRHGRSPAYQKMNAEFQFRLARLQQEDAAPSTAECTILPFVRVVNARSSKRGVWRADSPSKGRPHFPRVLRRSKARHAR